MKSVYDENSIDINKARQKMGMVFQHFNVFPNMTVLQNITLAPILEKKIPKAEAEQNEIVVKDFSKVEAILHSGWKGIYKNLDDVHKRAFWRSFIQSIEVNWTTDTKEIVRVNFF